MSSAEIDRVSRILATPGLDQAALEALQSQTVLICGMNGLGVEIAKNNMLFGLKACVLHDTKSVGWSDLGAQFYLSEADLGRNRAEVRNTPTMRLR